MHNEVAIMIQPTPVAPVAQTIPLDENFAANRVEAMRAMGAKNVDQIGRAHV